MIKLRRASTDRPKKAARPRREGRGRLPGWPRRSPAGPEEGGWISRDGYLFSPALQAVERPELRPESLDLLAGEIIDRHIRLGRRGLAVCAAAQGAGASFIAANLAVALSQIGVSTLLVDANLHRPNLENLIRAPSPRGGLAEALMGETGTQAYNVIHREVLPNLSVLYAGAAPAQASELIASQAFQALVSDCLRSFECVIFDTPPANRCPDARVIGAATGYALLVSRRAGSFADDLTLLSHQLDQDGVTVVGSVLNGV